jgi:tetratricopeptide (TPR) repeat protein
VADHWARAGERLQAADWYRRAWDRLWLISHKEGRRCSQEVLSLFEDTTGLGPTEAKRAAKAVIEACREALFLGWSLGLSREEADALLGRALDAAGEEGVDSPLSDSERANQLAWVHLGYGAAATHWDLGAAVRHSREGYALTERWGNEAERIEACRLLVWVLGSSGRFREAWELAEPEITNPPSDPLMGGTGRGVTPFPGLVRQGANALAWLGQPREALRLLKYALNLFRTDGRTVALEDTKLREQDAGHHAVGEDYFQPLGFAVICHYLLGDAEKAWRCVQTLRSGQVQRGDSSVVTAAGSGNLQLVLRLRCEWAELRRVAAEATELLKKFRNPYYEQRAYAFIALARAHLGDRDEAIKQAMGVLAIAFDPVVLESCVRTLLYTGGANQREAIETALEKMAGIIELTGGRAFSPFLHELRAQLALVRGDADTCESERREAERLWTEMGAHGHIERMAEELAELGAAK